jgi:predicted enzyme related to lactoylglutathione lyase
MTSPALRLLVLKTRQLECVREFYTRVGIEFAAEKHGSGPEHYAGRLGEIVLELYPLGDEQIPVDTTLRLGFAVADLNGVVESLAAAGARVARPAADSQWGRRAVVVDPDGRSIELYEA